MWWFAILLTALAGCSVGKNPYYQDNLVEIEGKECSPVGVEPAICEYQINYKGAILVVSEDEIQWR